MYGDAGGNMSDHAVGGNIARFRSIQSPIAPMKFWL
jgi:hypothetical protein